MSVSALSPLPCFLFLLFVLMCLTCLFFSSNKCNYDDNGVQTTRVSVAACLFPQFFDTVD